MTQRAEFVAEWARAIAETSYASLSTAQLEVFAAASPTPSSPRDPPEAKIVAALIALAHELKLTVTAEGVESRTQRDRLRALGCDTAQFATAGPPEHVTRHLARG